jgi:hypothetical protein
MSTVSAAQQWNGQVADTRDTVYGSDAADGDHCPSARSPGIGAYRAAVGNPAAGGYEDIVGSMSAPHHPCQRLLRPDRHVAGSAR